MIERRKLSSAIATAISLADLVVGLTVRPPSGGWSGNVPNQTGSDFIPFCVLTPEQASRSSGPIADPYSEWQMPYNLGCFGASAEQAEWVADKARAALHGLGGTDVAMGGETYRIQQVYPSTIGGVRRNDSTDPPHWGQNDLYTVWLSKEI